MEHEYELINRIKSGRRELFEQIVLKYQDLIYTVCFNIIRDGGDAENLAQETFLTAYCSLSGFRGENLKSWLCRIAVNKSVDFKRKQVKQKAEPLDAHENTARGGDSVEELLERKDRAEKLNNILAFIPEKYSSVVSAFYYDRLGVKEIARQSGIPEKTVETRLYRARKLIRERWGEDDI